MGSPANEEGRSDDEGPQTLVTLTKDFFLGATDVTQAQWTAVMGSRADSSHGARPAEIRS
jgi:formylglycine-generating enzyme required for sulfatase activity